MTESTRPPTADIKLTNGRIVTHTRKPNGSQDATMADGGTMSEAEGREADELRAAIVKNSDISRRILAAVQAGATIPAAFDAMLGVGAHAKMGGELYDTLIEANAASTAKLAGERLVAGIQKLLESA